MRYHLDTIPVWDALGSDSECFLCDLSARAEAAYLDSFLGASVMEPAVRIEVNEKGFCARHFAKMLPMQNRLGLALMTHTHLKQTLEELKQPGPAAKRGLFGRAEAAARAETCVLCDRLAETMARYRYTALHLWKTDPEFRRKLLASKGVCLPHYRALLGEAEAALGGKAQEFRDALYKVERENLDRIEKEIEWFTLKFDYRNADKPWGASKDAPDRAIGKLRGRV